MNTSTDGNYMNEICECSTSEDMRESRKRKFIDDTELEALRIQRVMISDEDGDRPIHIAAAQENPALVNHLCDIMQKAHVSIDVCNFLRQSPLHVAVLSRNSNSVKVLLKHGASLMLKDRNGNSAIQLAVKNFNKEVLSTLLLNPVAKDILNSLDHDGYAALHTAVEMNNMLAMKYLCKNGADVNVKDGRSGRTSLMLAILQQNLKAVEILLTYDANIEEIDYSGQTASDLGLQTSNSSIIKLLEKRMIVKSVVQERTISKRVSSSKDGFENDNTSDALCSKKIKKFSS